MSENNNDDSVLAACANDMTERESLVSQLLDDLNWVQKHHQALEEHYHNGKAWDVVVAREVKWTMDDIVDACLRLRFLVQAIQFGGSGEASASSLSSEVPK